MTSPKTGKAQVLASFPLLAFTLALVVFAFGPASASASKQAIAYFGSEIGTGTQGGEFSGIGDIAVNDTGAGPADQGDIYVIDGNRIQRFSQDNNGTPSSPYDDTFPFVSAWGAGVDSATAGDGYEVCTAAADCTGGESSGGSGGFNRPSGIAVDEDTGVLYVSDRDNYRVSAYAGDGTFLRSFGWDVVESGPDDAGTGYEVCVAANGDVCKAGIAGSGLGQTLDAMGLAVSQPDGNATTGTVYLADRRNRRVNTYGLDGGSPGNLGSATNFAETAPEFVAVDSRGIVYAADRSNNSEVDRYDSLNANGAGVGFLAPIPSPPLSVANNQRKGLEVDPDSDGAGPDSDILYVVRDSFSATTVVQQFGPVNAPGLLAPPSAEDDEHGALARFNFVEGLGLDTASGRLFISDPYNIGGEYDPAASRSGVYVLDTAGSPPTASLDSLSDVTASAVKVHATVDPNGGPPVTYRLEYSLDGTTWTSMPEASVGSQESPQQVTAVLGPPPVGLEPATFYHVRLRVTKAFTPPLTTSEATFTTLPTPPLAETTGSPVRTMASAQLTGRVTPRNSATSYFFEYGDQGPCDSSPCSQTPARPAGSGSFTELVSEEVTGLQSSTTYHYRVVADNGQPGSPVSGEDMTVTTRGPEASLSHGHFPGPPGSDRAWEQVSSPESGGNPVEEKYAISDDGTRSVWGLGGGSPITETGGFNMLFSERAPNGWQTKKVQPSRGQLAGSIWKLGMGNGDLSSFVAVNYGASAPVTVIRMSPEAAPQKLYEVPSEGDYGGFFPISADGSRALMAMSVQADPEHTVPGGKNYIYDVTSPGEPHMVSLMPDGSVPACGVPVFLSGQSSPYVIQGTNFIDINWLSPDGSRTFFISSGNACNSQPQLYMRNIDAAETKLVSGPVLSGPSCGAGFVKSTPEAVFFWTKSRLDAADTEPANCSDDATKGDVYRYDFAGDGPECLTCVVPNDDADVSVSDAAPARNIEVSDDGSRVYFRSASRLLSGARALGVYRLDTETGDLAYVGFVGNAGAIIGASSKINTDGSTLVFQSRDADLNALGGGAGNAGTEQIYRYDDHDHSLACLSCPQDGSAPRGDVSVPEPDKADNLNATALAAGSGIVAFSTPTPLVSADQNTTPAGHSAYGGTDVYEWRDGKLLLVSDGLINWPAVGGGGPSLKGITPSGHDIIFTAATQYTPDARDNYLRLYDARIGGGIEFPTPPPPCPLEVCQGVPKGAPEEQAPGTNSFAGPGNAKTKKVRHKKHRAKKHHHKVAKKHTKSRANHDRRSAR